MVWSPHADPAELLASAEDFIRLYHQENRSTGSVNSRLGDIRSEIRRSGTYVHTADELAFGARVAWRNSKRCLGRLYWRSLSVRDHRHVDIAEDIFLDCVEHLRVAFNNGRIRPVITVFAPERPDQPGPRIHNEQLIRYAGHRRPGDRITGDRRYADFTDRVRALGWSGGTGGRFDVLPLLIEGSSQPPRLFELPAGVVNEVRIWHPTYEWFADLDLRWYAVPVISDMTLEIGGVRYPAAPFNGWYMGTEIGARNLVDEQRYNMLPAVADQMGLDRSANHTLWKDRALVEVNVAVLWSFRQAGVTVTDHHTEAQRFMQHLRIEEQAGRRVPGDWSWLVPPISGGATPVFHRYYDDIDLSPNYLKAERPSGATCPMAVPGSAAGAATPNRAELGRASNQCGWGW